MHFLSFTGIVTGIHQFDTGMHGGMVGCMQIFTVENEQGQIVNFVVEPETYFIHHETIKIGDRITGFYDGDAPAILIYPPQYPAIVIAKENQHYFVKISFFIKINDWTRYSYSFRECAAFSREFSKSKLDCFIWTNNKKHSGTNNTF